MISTKNIASNASRVVAGLLLTTVAVAALPVHAQSPSVLYSFRDKNDGTEAVTGITRTSNGNLYVGAEFGGVNNDGTIARLLPSGAESEILQFDGTNTGSNLSPNALVVYNGFFYGTTFSGGAGGSGVLYRIRIDGKGFQVLHAFTGGVDGGEPDGSVFIDGSTLYGTAITGGANSNGVIYKISSTGTKFKVLHNFNVSVDGEAPDIAPTKNINGQLVGTTGGSGTDGTAPFGTAYTMNEDGTNFNTIYTFTDGTDGEFPDAGRLVADSAGNLYGATFGAIGSAQNGTLYKIDTSNNLTTIATFDGATMGSQPFSNLLLASNGLLYGATELGGAGGTYDGTLYSIDPSNDSFTLLHAFGTSPNDPVRPNAGNFIQGPDGTIYGGSFAGGANGDGTIYSFQP